MTRPVAAPSRRSNFLRHAAVALALAATASVASAAVVGAEPVDPGVRCAAQTGPGSYEFFLPGERAVDKDGNKWVCGPDGKWFRDYSSLQLPPPSKGSNLTKWQVLFVVPPTATVAKP